MEGNTNISQIDILKNRAKNLVNEDPEKTEELLAELRDQVTREEGLKVPEDRAFYLRFLRAGLSKPSDGLEIIKNYFLLRKNHFKYFKSATNLEKVTREVFSQQINAMLPNRDELGRRIYVFRPGRWNPDKISFEEVFCAGYLLSELVVREEETQISGLVTITDASGFGWKHMRAIGLDDGKNLAKFFNISFPLWVRQSHIINTPRVFNLLFSMLGPFCSENVRNNVVFHSSETTLRNYFSGGRILPSDLGGTGELGMMDNSQNVEELRHLQPYFTEILSYGYV